MSKLQRRALLAGLPILFAARPSAAQDKPWSMATEYPANTVSGDGIAFFAARLAQESGGRLAVQPSYDAAQGMKSADIVAAVRDGKLAAGCAFGGALGRLDALFGLPSLPFVTASESDAARLLDKARGLYVRRFAQEKQRLLYAAPWPPSGLWAKKPIVAPADLAGLRLRVYDATSLDVFTATGAKPANLPFADAGPRIADGSIEAVLSSGDGGAGRRLWEHLPHFTEIGYAVPLSFATLSAGLYDALSAELKGAVDRAAAATQTQAWASLAKRLSDNYARMKTNGVTITPAAQVGADLRALLAKSAASAVESWKQAAGPEAAALLS